MKKVYVIKREKKKMEFSKQKRQGDGNTKVITVQSQKVYRNLGRKKEF